MIITLPVSVGEAIDKLTILDIKLQKITDNRRIDVEKEYNLLTLELDNFIIKYPFHYRILKEINLEIWELQDYLRDKTNLTDNEYFQICKKIIEENDRRFRVKSKINRLSNSDLKEQKGYIKRSVYIQPHFGYGDIINMIGAIRYYSTVYEEVIVGCKEDKLKNLRMFFRDDPEIILQSLTYGTFEEIKERRQVNKVYICGYNNPNRTPITNSNVPDCFYQDLQLDPKIRTKYFYFPESNNSIELYNKLVETGKKYIFVHEKASNDMIDLQYLVDMYSDYLIVNCNRNMYSIDNKYYELLNNFINQSIIDYTDIIKNAEELYLIDSVMLCLANHLDLSKVNKKHIYVRNGREYPTYLQKSFIIIKNDELSIDRILDKYNIKIDTINADNYSNITALGIGDLLFTLNLLKFDIIDSPIYINLNEFSKYFLNTVNALEFRIRLINHICYYNDISINKIKFINNNNTDILGQQLDNICKLTNIKLKFAIKKIPNNLLNKEYIIFHTKCRFINGYNYKLLKEYLQHFFIKYKSSYQIILLGERKFLDTYEANIHGITTIYEELLLLKINNDIIDLTKDDIYNNLNFDEYLNDMSIINNAKYNICVGCGGQFCNSLFFGNNTIVLWDSLLDVYKLSNELDNIVFHRDTNTFLNNLNNINKKTYQLLDKNFDHAPYVINYQFSKYIKWKKITVTDILTESDNIVFVTDYFIGQKLDIKRKKVYAWLLEPRAIDPSLYQCIIETQDKYDVILTHHKDMLKHGPKFRYYPFGGTWITPEDTKIYPNKNKLVSFFISYKKMTGGHWFRHHIYQDLKHKFDVYGRGINDIANKVDGLRDYRYSIVVENSREDGYFTEKIVDCFACGTVPIYWGCPNIGEYFNINGIITFASLQELIVILDNQINDEDYNNRQLAIEENLKHVETYRLTEDYLFKNLPDLFILSDNSINPTNTVESINSEVSLEELYKLINNAYYYKTFEKLIELANQYINIKSEITTLQDQYVIFYMAYAYQQLIKKDLSKEYYQKLLDLSEVDDKIKFWTECNIKLFN
jgi:hypothetical protein